MDNRRQAFTLIELLVVITVIVVLLALLTPALDKAVDSAVRVRCGSQQKVIVAAATLYATVNKGAYFICKGRWVQDCFSPLGSSSSLNVSGDSLVDWPAALASVGLASAQKSDTRIPGGAGGTGANRVDNLPDKAWDCPGMKFQSKWDQAQAYQLIVGYMYHGGRTLWQNVHLPGGMPARSPLRLSKSQGGWALLTEYTVKVDGVWGAGRYPYYYPDAPAHKAGDRSDNGPAGQNQGYVDGSVEWVEAHRLIDIGNWFSDGHHRVYWYQQDLGGWDPPDDAYALPGPQ